MILFEMCSFPASFAYLCLQRVPCVKNHNLQVYFGVFQNHHIFYATFTGQKAINKLYYKQTANKL